MAGTIERLTGFLKAKGLSALLPALSKKPELMGALIEKLQGYALAKMESASGDLTPALRERKLLAGRMLFETIKKRLPTFSRATQRKLAFNMLFNNLQTGEAVRERYRAERNEEPPYFFVVSPSMRCNLRCFGCYAAEYEKMGELSCEEVIDLIEQGKKELGTYFVTISGGEPFFWPHLFEVLEHHSDVFFQIYTHGMLIDDAAAACLAELGNAYPAISVEGGREETDARRGAGAYDKILASMKRLREHGVMFGFSTTHTQRNHESIVSDAFVDAMVEAGATFGWFFQYILIGREPAPELVPTAEQRLERFEAVDRFRRTKNLVVYDFWNDGEATQGCIAYGRKYFHVNSAGYVEPCVFVHFAVDNIREKRLAECINSACFKEARGMMPFNQDCRFPCSMIDNVDVLPCLVRKHRMVPTHPGAESIIEGLAPAVRQTACQYWNLLQGTPVGAAADEDAKVGT